MTAGALQLLIAQALQARVAAAPKPGRRVEQPRPLKPPWSYWGNAGYGYDNIFKAGQKPHGLKNLTPNQPPVRRA